MKTLTIQQILDAEFVLVDKKRDLGGHESETYKHKSGMELLHLFGKTWNSNEDDVYFAQYDDEHMMALPIGEPLNSIEDVVSLNKILYRYE